MKAYGADYIMGMMSKQGELSEAAEGSLYREGLDQMLIGPIDRDALQVDMPKRQSSAWLTKKTTKQRGKSYGGFTFRRYHSSSFC